MLTLYIEDGCGYCEKVLTELKRLNLTANLKNIAQARYAAELERRGGVLQVPYLIDQTWGEEMYESDDIVRYLNDTYGAPHV